MIRVLLAIVVFVVALVFSVVTAIGFFWGNNTTWPLLYVLGFPLAAVIFVLRRPVR